MKSREANKVERVPFSSSSFPFFLEFLLACFGVRVPFRRFGIFQTLFVVDVPFRRLNLFSAFSPIVLLSIPLVVVVLGVRVPFRRPSLFFSPSSSFIPPVPFHPALSRDRTPPCPREEAKRRGRFPPEGEEGGVKEKTL